MTLLRKLAQLDRAERRVLLDAAITVATLRVGVAKNENGTLRAHAWLESGGRTLLGGPDFGTFVQFPPLAFPRQ